MRSAETSSSSSSPVGSAPSRGLDIGLWLAQVALALFFGGIGLMKVTIPAAEFIESAPEMADRMWLVRFIGASELAGALGLVLPAVSRILPRLVPLAALGILVIMVLAALLHASRGEWGSIAVNVALGGLAAFVMWGRARRLPIAPRR